MRILLILLAVVSVLSVAVNVHCQSNAYIGLYSESDQSSWCASGIPPYEVTIWVWVLTPEPGMVGVGLNLELPANCTYVTGSAHPRILPELTDPDDKSPKWTISGSLSGCVSGWMWTHSRTYLVDDSTPATIEIVAHPELGDFRIGRCGGGVMYPIRLTNVYINYESSNPECSVIGTEEKSWGCIKSLYR